MLIICVCAVAFAAVGTTVKLGIADDLFRIKTASGDDIPNSNLIKGSGFGGVFGVQYDLNDNTIVFMDYNIVFFSEAKIKLDLEGYDWMSIRDFYGLEADEPNYMNFWSTSIGAAYRMDFGSFKLTLGGGFNFNRFWNNMKMNEAGEKYDRIEVDTILGVATLIEGKYMLTRDLGITLTAKPQIGLLARHKHTMKYSYGSTTKKATAFAVSYAVPLEIGMAYSF